MRFKNKVEYFCELLQFTTAPPHILSPLDPPIQLFIVFIVPFAAAVILTLCFAAAQICCRRFVDITRCVHLTNLSPPSHFPRKSGGVHSKKLMKKLSKFKFVRLDVKPVQ